MAPLQVGARGSGTVQMLYFWDVDREKGMVLQGSQQDFALCQWFHQLLEPEIGVYEVARH